MMLPCRFTGFSSIAFTLWLGLLSAVYLYASPVRANEQSLGNGAQLYELYCSDCHGRESAKRNAGMNETDTTHDDSALIDIALGATSPEPVKPTAEEEWPEWATPRDPDMKEEPDMRAEILGVVTAVIDDAQTAQAGSDQPENAGRLAEKNRGRGFNTLSGATDLSAPQTFFYGTSEEELFKSIAHGTGAAMPGWRTELGSDEAIWDLVNYVRSFWGEEWLY